MQLHTMHDRFGIRLSEKQPTVNIIGLRNISSAKNQKLQAYIIYMLELRPSCEHCDKPLPNGSPDAMICTFECTFCKDCVDNVLHNVCPNCGGGFEKRPTRPTRCITEYCIENYPARTERKFRPVSTEKFAPVLDAFKDIPAEQR